MFSVNVEGKLQVVLVDKLQSGHEGQEGAAGQEGMSGQVVVGQVTF